MNNQQKVVLITVVVLISTFIILSPGVILNLPPHKNRFKTRNILFTGETSVVSAVVHSLVFGIISYFFLKNISLSFV